MEFDMDEGRYLFTFVATDKAGQIAEKVSRWMSTMPSELHMLC